MVAPYIEDRSDAGTWAFVLTYHKPSFLRVEDHIFEQPDDECPDGNCVSGADVFPFHETGLDHA